MTAQMSLCQLPENRILYQKWKTSGGKLELFSAPFQYGSCHVFQSTNRTVPNSISKGSRKTRLTENVGNRRNSPGCKETQIRTERTSMRQFSSFSVIFYADSLKFGAKAANYA